MSTAAGDVESDKKEREAAQHDDDCKVFTFTLDAEEIRSIDVVEQQFTLSGNLVIGWETTKEKYDEYKACKDVTQFCKDVDPSKYFKFVNGTVNMKLDDNRVVKAGDRDYYSSLCADTQFKYTFLSMQRFDGQFQTSMDLRQFPFDCQSLNVQVQLRQPTDVAVFLPKFGAGPESYYERGMQLVWDPRFVNEWEFSDTKASCFAQQYTMHYSTFQFEIKVKRKYTSYLWKLVFIMFVVTACAFLVFTMDIDKNRADMYSLLITLLLTAVAFQFVTGEYVPTLPYLTALDKYILSAFVVIVTVIAEVAVCSLAGIDESAFNTVGIVSCIVFVLAQLCFFASFWIARVAESRKLARNYFETQAAAIGTEQDDRICSKVFLPSFVFDELTHSVYKRCGIAKDSIKVYK